jgi:hypothetical protein
MIRIAMFILGIVAAGGAHAATATAAIGDLMLEYDDAEWRPFPSKNGATLRPVDCSGFRCEDGTAIVVSIAPAGGPLPTEVPRTDMGFVKPLWELVNDLPPWPGQDAIREVNGFTIFATDRWSGCRAMSPSELTAILDHAGMRYTFTSGVAAACGGVWGVDREAFVSILAGLRPRD